MQETAGAVAHALTDRPLKQGDGWRAPCPAHGGADNNLSIRDGDHGGLMLRCWSHADAASRT